MKEEHINTQSGIKKENKMGTQPIGKLLFTMSLPAILSMLVNALYNIVDSIFVAHISEDALSALSLVFPLQFLIIAVALFVIKLMSESSYFAQRIDQTIAGDSSGRDDLYKSLWDILISEQDLFYILFGRGADATWALVGNYAHQDWLETFCNNGLLENVI